ncbi:hypothetical protein ACHAWO_003681 [Cyclotella atomus]|uniref:Uncharacterized protein n=1 Tax=Cyclotella atomus TaxID=382360 RepID=A0ABD3QDK4_9STRA
MFIGAPKVLLGVAVGGVVIGATKREEVRTFCRKRVSFAANLDVTLDIVNPAPSNPLDRTYLIVEGMPTCLQLTCSFLAAPSFDEDELF